MQNLRLMLLSLGLSTTLILAACCNLPTEVAPPAPTQVIVVDDTEIVENENGTFTVSRGWMLKRMDLEDQLGQRLQMCMTALDDVERDLP